MKLKDYLLNIQEFVFSLTRAHFMIIKYQPRLHISRFVTYTVNNYMEIIGTLLVIPMSCIGIIPIPYT